MKTGEKFIVLSVVICAFLVAGQAQVVREEGVVSIAGVLWDTGETNDFYFATQGGEVLFASIDASIYQSAGRGESADSGGCEDSAVREDGLITGSGCPIESGSGTTHDTSGGCSGEGGSLHFKLELYNQAGDKICHAGRPINPGWQRDPRLFCVIPSTLTPVSYTLRVMIGGMGSGGHADAAVTTSEQPGPGVFPYLLNASLRTIVPGGYTLQQAGNLSKNRF